MVDMPSNVKPINTGYPLPILGPDGPGQRQDGTVPPQVKTTPATAPEALAAENANQRPPISEDAAVITFSETSDFSDRSPIHITKREFQEAHDSVKAMGDLKSTDGADDVLNRYNLLQRIIKRKLEIKIIKEQFSARSKTLEQLIDDLEINIADDQTILVPDKEVQEYYLAHNKKKLNDESLDDSTKEDIKKRSGQLSGWKNGKGPCSSPSLYLTL